MGKSQETFSKKGNEKKKLQKRKDKQEKRELRQANNNKGKGLDEMLAYVDENGNITNTPPDPNKKKVINSEDIVLGAHRQDNEETPDVDRKGIVTFFNESKGYGFIKDDVSKESVFVHINSVKTPIKDNDKVTFKVEKGPKGLNAVGVEVVK